MLSLLSYLHAVKKILIQIRKKKHLKCEIKNFLITLSVLFLFTLPNTQVFDRTFHILSRFHLTWPPKLLLRTEAVVHEQKLREQNTLYSRSNQFSRVSCILSSLILPLHHGKNATTLETFYMLT